MLLFSGIAKIENFEITIFNADLFIQTMMDSSKN